MCKSFGINATESWSVSNASDLSFHHSLNNDHGESGGRLSSSEEKNDNYSNNEVPDNNKQHNSSNCSISHTTMISNVSTPTKMSTPFGNEINGYKL